MIVGWRCATLGASCLAAEQRADVGSCVRSASISAGESRSARSMSFGAGLESSTVTSLIAHADSFTAREEISASPTRSVCRAAFLRVEGGADLLGERDRSERLLQEIDVRIDEAPVRDIVRRIARHEQHRDVRLLRRDRSPQFATFHLGKYDVGEQEIEPM